VTLNRFADALKEIERVLRVLRVYVGKEGLRIQSWTNHFGSDVRFSSPLFDDDNRGHCW